MIVLSKNEGLLVLKNPKQKIYFLTFLITLMIPTRKDGYRFFNDRNFSKQMVSFRIKRTIDKRNGSFREMKKLSFFKTNDQTLKRSK